MRSIPDSHKDLVLRNRVVAATSSDSSGMHKSINRENKTGMLFRLFSSLRRLSQRRLGGSEPLVLCFHSALERTPHLFEVIVTRDPAYQQHFTAPGFRWFLPVALLKKTRFVSIFQSCLCEYRVCPAVYRSIHFSFVTRPRFSSGVSHSLSPPQQAPACLIVP